MISKKNLIFVMSLSFFIALLLLPMLISGLSSLTFTSIRTQYQSVYASELCPEGYVADEYDPATEEPICVKEPDCPDGQIFKSEEGGCVQANDSNRDRQNSHVTNDEHDDDRNNEVGNKNPVRNTNDDNSDLEELFADNQNINSIPLQVTRNNNTFPPNTASVSQSGSNLSTYVNSTYGIKILYPSSWQVQENHDVRGTKDSGGLIASFISPQESESDKFMESVYLYAEDVGNIGLTDYAAAIKNNSMRDSPNFRLNEFNLNSYYLSGFPAYKIDASDRLDGTDIKSVEIGTIVNHTAYPLTFFTDASKYAEYLPVMQTMIDSLQVNGIGNNVSNIASTMEPLASSP